MWNDAVFSIQMTIWLGFTSTLLSPSPSLPNLPSFTTTAKLPARQHTSKGIEFESQKRQKLKVGEVA
jgi:hypothetical protein